MKEAVLLEIQGEHDDADPHGGDASILEAPAEWYLSGALLVQIAAVQLRDFSDDFVQQAGGRLHHADWVFTDDGDLVRKLVHHGCVNCQAGADRAVAFLRDNPGREVAVGQLWWTT